MAPLVSIVQGQLVLVEALAGAGRVDLVGDAADGREQRVDRDIADRGIFGTVPVGGDVALAGVDGELDVDLGAVVEMADHQIGVEHLDVAGDLDVAGGHGARALLGQRQALRALATHLEGDFLDVEHEVGDVLAHARKRGEFVQHAVDLDRGHGRALQRRQQHATQRIAQGQAVAALKRLGDDRGRARVSLPETMSSLVGLISSCQFLWMVTVTSFQKSRRSPGRSAANAKRRRPDGDPAGSPAPG